MELSPPPQWADSIPTYVSLRYVGSQQRLPTTDGEAKRFSQTSVRERAYARARQTSNERADVLP